MATWASNQSFFTMLPDARPPLGKMGAGLAMEALLLFLVITVPLLMPQKLQIVANYVITPIEAPPVVAWKPQPVQPKPTPVKPVVKKEEPPKLAVAADPPKPKIMAPVFMTPVVKPAERRSNRAPETPQVAETFKNNLTLGNSATPTLKAPRAPVQTGGFGDPNGLPATGNPNRAANIAKLGSFDLPPGPGYGNGTGGAHGVRGVVGSTGFGNGVAKPAAGSASHGSVQTGGFADETPAAAPKARQVAAPAGGATKPVEILYKPRPVYTEQARAKKIEGEVLLQVVFTASGQVEVGQVVQGLGYGMNDAAIAAARQIRFKPAMRDGQLVDSSAIVHIVFELAY